MESPVKRIIFLRGIRERDGVSPRKTLRAEQNEFSNNYLITSANNLHMTNILDHFLKLFQQPLLTFISCFTLISCAFAQDIHIMKGNPEVKNDECVILIHGMGRTYRSMLEMQEMLSSQGYYTINLGYPSTELKIEKIADDYFPLALKECKTVNPSQIHMVTHSLGGIIVRQAMRHGQPANLGRIVMLSPPNKGSELVDKIKNWKLFRWITGPAGQQLTTDNDALPQRLGGVKYPVGIITGNRHAFFDSWFASVIPGIDDGKVSPEGARLEGMKDFLIVEETHPFIMNSEYVQRETLHFLKQGRFSHKNPTRAPDLGLDWFSE